MLQRGRRRGGGGGEVRDFPQSWPFSAILLQLPLARPPRARAPCVPCAEVLLLEAVGGLVTAIPRKFAQSDLTLPDRTPPPPLRLWRRQWSKGLESAIQRWR